jgi:hypothetical protein
MFILPWLTLPLMGKDTIKKFYLSGIFITLVTKMESIIAKRRKWWGFNEKIHQKLTGEFPFIYGPFLIGSMWILKFTYGKLLTYMITNLFIDSIFIYPFVSFLEKQGIGTLIKLKKYQFSILFFIKSIFLYGYQFLRERFNIQLTFKTQTK